MSNSYATEAFLIASRKIQNQFSVTVLTRKWNRSGLGKPAKETTVRRWLNLGPYTKNPRFEPWVVGLASIAA